MTGKSNPVDLTFIQDLTAEVFPMLAEVREAFGPAFCDPLSTQMSGIISMLRRHAAETNEDKTRLLKEQLRTAQVELAMLEKEQEDFFNRCDRDIEYAVNQWQEESKKLTTTVKTLQDEKRSLLSNLARTSTSLNLHNQPNRDDSAQPETDYVDQLHRTISRLQEHWIDKCSDLIEAHQELDSGLEDLSSIADLYCPPPCSRRETSKPPDRSDRG